MTRQWRTGLIVILAVALVLFAWERWERAREPRYGGRTVSQWFRYYCQSGAQAPGGFEEEAAAEAFKRMGTNALPYLLKQAFTIKPDTRGQKIFYGFLGAFPRSWGLPVFISNEAIRTDAAEAIRRMNPAAEVLLPELEKHLKAKVFYEHNQAIYLVGSLGEGGERGVPYLVAELKGTNSWGQTLALQSLRFQGLKARAAVPTLIELLRQQTPGSSTYLGFARTLASGGSNALEALLLLEPAFNSNTNWETRCILAGAICKIDPTRTNEFNFLVNGIKNDSDPKHRSNAIQGLIDIGTNSPAVVPVLAQMIGDPQDDVSSRAAFGLKTLGAARELYVPQFEKGLQSTNENVIANSASQILWADPDNRAGLQAMMELIKRRSVYEGFAIQRLGEIGPAAKDAASLLQEVIATHDEHLRKDARKALKRIVAPTNSVSYR